MHTTSMLAVKGIPLHKLYTYINVYTYMYVHAGEYYSYVHLNMYSKGIDNCIYFPKTRHSTI